MPWPRVTIASARGRSSCGQGGSTTTTRRCAPDARWRAGRAGGPSSADRAAAIFGDVRGIVARAEAAIQRREDALADAAFAGEEAVPQTPAVSSASRAHHHAETAAEAGGRRQTRLGQRQHLEERPSRAGSISAPQPVRMVSAAPVSRLWRAASPRARAMPRPARKPPCVIGPWTRAPAFARCRGERGEIDMRGEIGAAGRGENRIG